MNNVQLIGRLVRDPEIKYSTGENSNAMCRFSIAVQRTYKNAEGNYDADFPSCIAFRKTAEFVNKYFHKGDMIGIIGHIMTGSYTNKDGVKVYTTDVVADSVEFVGVKSASQSDGGDTSQSRDSSFVNVPEGTDEELPW